MVHDLMRAPPTLLAVDPGPTECGYVYMAGEAIAAAGVCPTPEMLERVQAMPRGSVLACEMIASYGMAVGAEVFETCVWIGRFQQAFCRPDEVILVFRKDVKLLLCGQTKAKDANVRQALIDMYPRTGGGKVPQIGTAKLPGPLWGVTSHAWPALAVAKYALHKITARSARRTARL